MPDIIISEKQFHFVHDEIEKQQNLQLAKENWEKFTENEKKFAIDVLEAFYPKKSKVIKEAWYNTLMDVVGIVDPTGIVDVINGISYFSQGNYLFGTLTLIAAIPYAGDIVAKPVLGALKIGSKSTKSLESAMKIMTTAKVGSAEYKQAENIIQGLATKPGIIGSFLQKMSGSLGTQVLSILDRIPNRFFKGFKNTLKDYVQLLINASKKGVRFSKESGELVTKFSKGTAKAEDVQKLKNILKTERIFDVKTLSKPGFMKNVFFGGIPRLFRSPEQRRLKIMMQSTKWWLGALDFMGFGNFVGPDEAIKDMGEEEFMKKLEEYQKTPEASKYFDEQFGETTPTPEQQPSSNVQSPKSGESELQNFLAKLIMGQINPSGK